MSANRAEEVRLIKRANVDGIALEYEAEGSGDPVVFIHGGLFESFGPMAADPALDGFRLIRYCRRGYAGSKGDAAVPIARQAADCLALIRFLDAAPAHVVAHSSGGVIALQLALDAPEAVRSLTLLEPALLSVPSGGRFFEKLAPAVGIYQAGDKAGAVDTFMRGVCGDQYRAAMEMALPGTIEQAIADSDSFFGGEFPAVGEWTFDQTDAARIRQPVLSVLGANSDTAVGLPVYEEINERVLEWFPNAKPFVLPRAAHLLHVENPHDMAEGLAAYLASA
jgi:pimeloyl-ACP methyl ester carboxylesterase